MNRSDVNRCRVWYTGKAIRRNSTEVFAVNTMGFYALNGESVHSFPEKGTAETFTGFLEDVRKANGDKPVLMILDNCRIHKTEEVLSLARKRDIFLCFLPPYSPQLNPIEIMWKTIKRRMSRVNPTARHQIESVISETFEIETSKLSYATKWIEKFMPKLSNSLGQ